MASVITMGLSRPTNQLGNYAAPFLVLGQTKAAGSGVASYMLVSTQEERHGFERELRCSIECWLKSKDLRPSNKRFGRVRANRKTARCPSGDQMRPIARFDGRYCQS